MGGKSKKQTVGYKYSLGMHLGLCHGPIDKITMLKCDDRIAWQGSATGGPINVNAPELFGGDKREGGVSGIIDVEMGGPTQGKNAYLVSKLGTLIPAYRGIVSLVFRGGKPVSGGPWGGIIAAVLGYGTSFYLGNNPYLKPWSVRGQRVYKRENGAAQWYSAKAGIPITVEVQSTFNVDLPGTMTPPNQRTVAAIIANDLGHKFSATPDSVVSFKPTPGGALKAVDANGDGWRWPLRVMGDDNGAAPLYSIPGNPQYATPELCLAAVENHLVTSSFSTSGFTNYRIWTDLEGSNAPMNESNGGLSVTATIVTPVGLDMNAAHIIRECLTDANWGMGYTEADIDDESFTYAADTFYNEGMGLSLLWDKSKTIEDFITVVQQHVDCALYVSRKTGKFVIKPIRADYDEATLLHLNESNIISVSDPTKVAFGELTNSVTVTYWDIQTGKDATVTVTDPAMVQQQGVPINAPIQYPGFTNARNATIAANRDLRVLSEPLLSCTILANSEANVLNIGDVFKYSWGRWGLNQVIMRVNGIAYGNGRNKRVRIECTRDVFDTDTNVPIVVPDPGWSDPSAPPTAMDQQLAVEAPYFELVQALGQADTDNKLLTHPEIGYYIAAGGRPSSAINATLYTDNGTEYEDVGALDFCPVATLAASIGKLETSFEIANGEDLDGVVIGSHVQIGEELMRVDALDMETNILTVGRGVLDTVPAEHDEDEDVFFWDQFAGFDPTEYVQGEEVNGKIVPVSGAGVLPFDEAPVLTVDMAGRAARPYAPGDFRVNGEAYAPDAFYEGEIALSWAHRDRLQQTAGVLVDATEGSIGPEAGTTYRVQAFVGDTLIFAQDDIDADGFLWTPLQTGTIRVEVHAKRDGLYSFQAPSHVFTNASFRLTEELDVRYTEGNDARTIED